MTTHDQAGLARRVGEVMAAGKKAATAAKISLRDAVRQILEGQRDTSRKIAGDWLSREAMIQINNLNLGSSIDQTYPVALRMVMRAHPEVNAMYESGTVSELAMRTIFVSGFEIETVSGLAGRHPSPVSTAVPLFAAESGPPRRFAAQAVHG